MTPNKTDLIKRLYLEVKDDSIMGNSILYGIHEGDVDGTIKMIKDQAQDNWKGMCAIVGEDLLKNIVNLKM